MSTQPIYAGHALRRLRRKANLTQAAMASRLDISASYLNLLERNQRPLSARVMMQLVGGFDFDPKQLSADEAVGGIDGLSRRLADERFADLSLDREDIDELLAVAPQFASAFARLYDAASTRDTSDTDPLTACRKEIERWQNYFGNIDEAAERLADELRLSRADVGAAIAERLRERHQLSVRILPDEVMLGKRRRLDLHARQVQLSEMQSVYSRNFSLAAQLAELELRQLLAEARSGFVTDDTSAADLFARHLVSYAAAAVLMPYSRFLRACRQTNYDFAVLPRRFSVDFEQLAHRLTTLQRVGDRGLPFFLIRVDRAGQISKQLLGASGAAIFETGQLCPLWRVFDSFAGIAGMHRHLVTLADSKQGSWFSVAQSVDRGEGSGIGQFAILLGIKADYAEELAQSRGFILAPESAEPIGPGCRYCFRRNCAQRAFPPQGSTIEWSEGRRTSI